MTTTTTTKEEIESNNGQTVSLNSEADGGEMRRVAMRLTIHAFAELQSDSLHLSERELLEKYILMCPYIDQDNPVVLAALEGIERSKFLYETKTTATTTTTTTTIKRFDSKGNGTREHESNDERFKSNSNLHTQFDDAQVTRTAIRFTMRTIAELHLESQHLSCDQLLKKYIRQCPFLPPNSPVIIAALKGINQPQTTRHVLSSGKATDPDFVGSTPVRVRKMAVQNFEVKKISGLSTERPKKCNRLFVFLGYFIRTVILDLPLMLVLASLLAVFFTQRLYFEYWGPLLRRLAWSDRRSQPEQTYYNRFCDVTDMSTRNPADLFLHPNATSEHAYQHQLLHGFTVFPKVLTEDTATALRDFVISRNHNLSKEESIFVIENKNRYSFGLGTEEPSVVDAIGELANHPRLVPALEKILGKNPALIEMTAITSTYGAINQHWHDDVVSRASAIQFGRTFGPSYSIFVQLQNTTKQMGATATCPGSHLCPAGPSGYCKRHGFQLVNADGIWSTGDALLMNMNSWHRGSAHTALGGADRVMLILTFVPKPKKHSETRQMSQGITFSLRWDMWGHTLEDLASAETRMKQPWATLRALGLYKPKNADWGIDYITGSAMRMASEDNGYQRPQLTEYIERGGIKWLPRFLHGRVSKSQNWEHYYFHTLINCKDFLIKALFVGVVAFIFAQLLILLVGVTFAKKGSNGPFKRFALSFGRLSLWSTTLWLLYQAAISHIDSTQWARDIRAGRLYAPSFSSEEMFFTGLATFPYRDDILIETRYGSAYLNMYNDFINAHPGNLRFWEFLTPLAQLYTDYKELPSVFREHLSERLVDTMLEENRRFLFQNPESHWVEITRASALLWSTERLQSHSNDVLREVTRQVRYLMSECKYGRHRGKVMTEIDILPYLDDLLLKFLNTTKVKADSNNSTSIRLGATEKEEAESMREKTFPSLFILGSKPRSKARFVRRPVQLHRSLTPKEPERGAWIKQGDTIEAYYYEEGVGSFWYYATVEYVTSNALVHAIFSEGDKDQFAIDEVRRYEEIRLGEIVQVFSGQEFVDAQVIQKTHQPDQYDIRVIGQNRLLIKAVPKRQFRRKAS